MSAEAVKLGELENSWKQLLAPQLESSCMVSLLHFLRQQQQRGKVIYPASCDVFRAFELTPFDRVKVVIIGQDPYHNPDQAHGLAFSVAKGIKPPPSLVNIYKELSADLSIEPVVHGCLTAWASQGVLLLNSVLTVEQNCPGAHQGRGWEQFTDQVVTLLSERREHLVFMLWGGYAQKKGLFIDQNKHLVLNASHPSPLSAYRGFLGCKHFSKANDYLLRHYPEAVDWQLPT